MREAYIERKTKETEIRVRLNLDGTGEAQVKTGIGFFDHMLTAFARFAYLDLVLEASGDLEVDPHHTIEDCGIVLGQALREACGDKIGIERIGEALIAYGRSPGSSGVGSLQSIPTWFGMWSCPDGMVGEFPVEMAEEFFRALAVQSGITLHVRQLSGKNRHHILEAAFKGVGRALGLGLTPEYSV